jgi:c-di-AMP phosphodiesterase-like protein
LNILIYFEDKRAGVIVTIFVVIYFIFIFTTYIWNKPVLTKEMIHFATQYATVQKQLLDDFEIPYAILDINGIILWMNKEFEQLTGKDKGYHKTIFTIFPMISKDQIQKGEKENLRIGWEDKIFRAAIEPIYLEKKTEESSIIEVKENENLIALYLYDETELNQYIQMNQEQKLVASLVYIDNYEEALDSIEDALCCPH